MPRAPPRKRPTSRSSPYKTEENEPLRLACPFFKNDPTSCPHVCHGFSCLAKRLPDLKQHIELHHAQPLHCPTCGEIFNGDDKDNRKAAHIRERACPKRDFSYDGVTPDMLTKLRNASKETQREKKPQVEAPGAATLHERRWYWMFSVVLPGAQLPKSPHFVQVSAIDSSSASHAIGNIRLFRPQALEIVQLHGCERPEVLVDHFLEALARFLERKVYGTQVSAATDENDGGLIGPPAPSAPERIQYDAALATLLGYPNHAHASASTTPPGNASGPSQLPDISPSSAFDFWIPENDTIDIAPPLYPLECLAGCPVNGHEKPSPMTTLSRITTPQSPHT